MERKLATIRKIKEIRQIEGADNIECIIIDGWQCVSKKDEFKAGDLCVYCEIDSILPPRPEFSFLEKVKYRIRTIRLRGQISQGICFPVSILSGNKKILDDINPIPISDIIYPTIEFVPCDDGHQLTMFYDSSRNKYLELNVGDDVTEILGIIKYDPPIPVQLSGKVKGNFPSFLKKTDEERIQNMEWVLGEYKDKIFYVTEKIDGTSFTAYFRDGQFGVCSRNLDLIETDDNTLWKVARELKLEEKMKDFGRNIALQGELIGEGIQKNKYRLKGQTILFFNVFDIDKYEYFDYKKFIETIVLKFGLKTVPLVSDQKFGFYLLPTTKEMLEFAEAKSKLNPNQEREGVVVRPYENIEHPKHGRISFKIISNKYLLKNEN